MENSVYDLKLFRITLNPYLLIESIKITRDPIKPHDMPMAPFTNMV